MVIADKLSDLQFKVLTICVLIYCFIAYFFILGESHKSTFLWVAIPLMSFNLYVAFKFKLDKYTKLGKYKRVLKDETR